MSKHATELCLLLVTETYGGLTSKVFGTLTTHGRLARSRLAQLSKLTPIQINHSLAVLIQQRLAFWYTDPITDITYYEASLGGAYELIRTGKHIQLIKDRFGVFASDILTNYLLLGHIRVRDLEDAYNLSRDGTTAGNANGHDNPLKAIRTTDQEPTLDLLHSTICDLLQHCILSPVHESHFRSPADNRNEAESFVRATCDFTSGTKAKQNAEFEQKVQDTLEGWRTGIEATKRILKNHSTQAGKKRRLGASATDDHQQKRVKLANGFTAVNFPEVSCGEGQGALLDKDLMLHMNYDKLAILLRNQRLMTLVEESIGKPTSLVFCAILRSIENNVEYFDASSEDISEESGDTISFRHLVSTKDICLNFPDTKELEQGVGHADTQNIDSEQLLEKSKRKKPQLEDEAEVSGKASSDEEEDDVRSQTDEPQMNGNVHNADANFQRDRLQIEIVRKHLLLLVEHPYHFLYHHRKAHARGESWSVHFPSLVQHLRTQELDHTINARYGDHALRLVRLLQEKGKVDEKTLSRLSLLNQKLMRASLAAMHAGGHLELQEVPRDAIRAPSRTIFLWHFDPERCRLKLLEEVYKAMTRHLQRMRVEKEEMRSLLDKSRRTDVIGREAELLSTQEIRSLGEWNRKEEVFLGEISRLDDLIIVLGNVGGQFGAR